MVQAQPNRSLIRGRVTRLSADSTEPLGWADVEIADCSVSGVAGTANMLAGIAGTVVSMRVPTVDLARAKIAVGHEVQLEARRVSPQAIIGDGSSLTRISG